MLEGNKFKMFIIKLFVYFENFKFIWILDRFRKIFVFYSVLSFLYCVDLE